MLVYNSQYNFRFNTEEGILFYNANTGAVLLLSQTEGDVLGKFLLGEKKVIREEEFDDALLLQLLRSGFLVREQISELSVIQERYWKARGETPMVLTITTTMDCNLGCYYCYESRTRERLQFEEINQIISLLQDRIKDANLKSLHVDWYGGEPLLNMAFLEQASMAIQEFCQKNGVNYHASVISNGTLWPPDLEDFMRRHRIRQVQISIDGLEENHNKRRRYRAEYKIDTKSSYNLALELVEELLNYTQVDLRFNLDWKNKADIMPFLDLIEAKGWFQKPYPLVFQPARLSSYTQKSSFLRDVQLTQEEFNEIRAAVARRLNGQATVEESEVPEGFPFPKTYVCAALSKNSFVVGADMLLYHCGLQVGEKHRAVGSLDNSVKEFKDAGWWDRFDPCVMPSCSKCSFLPVCWGGCPKKHLESDQYSLDEQSIYWRHNLYKKVVSYVKCTFKEAAPLTAEDQFRHGYNSITN